MRNYDFITPLRVCVFAGLRFCVFVGLRVCVDKIEFLRGGQFVFACCNLRYKSVLLYIAACRALSLPV